MKTFAITFGIMMGLTGLVLGSPLDREKRAEGLTGVGNISGGAVQVVGENSRIVGPSGSITTNFGDGGAAVAQPAVRYPVAVPVAVPMVPVDTSYETIVSHKDGVHLSSGGPGFSRFVSVGGGNVAGIDGDDVIVSERRYPYGSGGGAGIGVVGDISGGNVVGMGGNGK